MRTLDNMKWSGSARYSTHDRHMERALTEFTGLDPDELSFDVTFSTDLGTDPMEEVTKLWDIERAGLAVPLTIGTHGYGIYRWNITKHELKTTAFFRNGDIHTATVSLSLQEYLRC